MSDDKICFKCNAPIHRLNRTGLCEKCYSKAYKQKHKERERANNERWYAKHREEKLTKAKETYDPEAKKKWRTKYYQENKEAEFARDKAWKKKDREANPEKWKQKCIEEYKRRKESGFLVRYFQENKERIRLRRSKHRVKNKDTINARVRNRYRNDIQFRLGQVLRTRLCEALKNNQKTGSAVRDLGCSVDELKLFLESRFYSHSVTQQPMSWDSWSINESGWQIDHIIPMMNFDLTDPEQLKKACHYSNLQPLWYPDHLKKSIEERRKAINDISNSDPK